MGMGVDTGFWSFGTCFAIYLDFERRYSDKRERDRCYCGYYYVGLCASYVGICPCHIAILQMSNGGLGMGTRGMIAWPMYKFEIWF